MAGAKITPIDLSQISPIDWRGDGSIAFDVDDVTVRWRPPKIKHLRSARNSQFQIATEARDLLATRDDEDFDYSATLERIETLAADWVRAVHTDLRLEGDLPDDVGEWPSWLPTVKFTTAAIQHWGSNPFA